MRKIEIAHEEEEIRRRTEEDERAGAKERRRKAGRFRVSRPLTADFSLRLPNPHPHRNFFYFLILFNLIY
jgi:hypothetical protein